MDLDEIRERLLSDGLRPARFGIISARPIDLASVTISHAALLFDQ